MLDRAGRRTGVELASQPLRLARDAVGRSVATEFGSASITSRYDPVGRLTERTLSGMGDAAPSWQVGYGYSPAGDLITARDSALGVRDYELDPAGRVLAVAGATAESYRYDPAGNLTSAVWNSGGGSEASGQREYAGTLLTRAGRDHYDYDQAGRLVRRRRHLLSGGVKEWRFAWNPLNQLVEAHTPDGHHWRYSYDPFGRRTGKQHFTAQGELVEEYRFAWDGPVLVEQIHTTPASVTTTTWEHEGLDPIAQTRTIRSTAAGNGSQARVDAEFAAIVTDLVGVPIRLVDTEGNTTWSSRPTLWGITGPDPVMPLRFPGQYHDPETGLHYNLHRYYDPDNARYLTPDPLGLAPSPNPYTYPANPTRQIDPYGLAPQPHQPGNNSPHTSSVAANTGTRALPSGPKIVAQWGADTYKHGGLMSTIEHINYRHAFNSGFKDVSRFAQGTSARQIKGYVDEALRTGTVTDRGVIAELGRTIGTDRAGSAVTGLEVIVRDGMIKTAYPMGFP